MPGQQLQTNAILLARQPAGSDSFEQITAFSETDGMLHCLRREAKGSALARSQGVLDLFDEAELSLESSNQGRTWFIKEHRLIVRPTGIGKSYDALKAAAGVAALVARNPVPDDSLVPVAALLRQTFSALSEGGRPDLVWLKALFCFIRDEGLPVKQHWWEQLPSPDRDSAAQILNHPLAAQNPDKDLVARLTHKLEDWLGAETEIKIR